jgi:hypothetical protein
MVEAHKELVSILREVRAFLALPDNDFTWSSWGDAGPALQELDVQIRAIEDGQLPPRIDLEVLFAPTGPIQEVSLSSGWSQDYLMLAERFDAAITRAYP